MKLPTKIIGVIRAGQSDRCNAAIRSDAGVPLVPSDVFCEDACHEAYEIGGDEHEACLDDCRDSG